MYENILYFIIVILVYSTYQPPATPFLGPAHTLALFAVFGLLFILITKRSFLKCISGSRQSKNALDLKLANAVTRQSVMAVMLFAIDIYGLNLPAYLKRSEIFTYIPTLGVTIFFIIFIFYMMIVWALAHDAHVRIHGPGVTRKQFLSANLMFAIPVILPWFLISLVMDIIGLLPFGTLKPFIDSIPGQVLIFVLFLAAIATAGPWFIIKAWGCKPLPEGPDRQRIKALTQRAGTSFARIMYWPLLGGRMITAGVMGIFKRFRYLLVTPALLELLSDDEIDGVISHEIGHVRHHHMLFYFIFLVGYTIISYTLLQFATLATVFVQIAFSGPVPSLPHGNDLTSFAFGAGLVIVFILYFRYGFGYFMRNFERQADVAVYPLTGSALPLISTFYKIASFSGQSPDRPNWHHFSINERISFLQKCEQDGAWIRGHHRKVRISVAVYLAVMTFLGVLCYRMNSGQTGQAISTAVIKTALSVAAARNPDTAYPLVALGDFYYARENYADTIKNYSQALDRDAHNLQALNNLAWLYATCPEKKFRKPETALKLAQRAAGLSEAPHILDTLAEALYANGFYGPAVIVSSKAAHMAVEDKGYYVKQLERFEAALEINGPVKSPSAALHAP